MYYVKCIMGQIKNISSSRRRLYVTLLEISSRQVFRHIIFFFGALLSDEAKHKAPTHNI